MFMPINERNLFDNFFEDFARPSRYVVKRTATPAGVMKTDIKENENEYEIDMELPGYKKENVTAELNEGYLTVTAKTENKEEQKEESGKFIRRERYYGESKRTFYVGDNLETEDILAKFEDGILKLTVPKKAAKPEIEKSKLIQIAG